MLPLILTRINLTGAFNYITFKTSSELERVINQSEKCVVFFGFEDLNVNWLNFPLNYYKNTVTFIRTTIQDGLKYNCTKSSIVSFSNGKKFGKKLKRHNTLAFMKWIDHLIYQFSKKITSPEVLRQLLQETENLIFVVDTEKPDYLQNNFTYFCSRSVFSVLNIDLEPGIYYFRGCDRTIAEFKNNTSDFRCPIDDISIINASQKPYICGFLIDASVLSEEFTLPILEKIKEKYGNYTNTVLFSSPYANYYLERSATKKVPKPSFLILNTKNYSQGKWYLTKNINNTSSVLNFVNRTIHNLEKYKFVSKVDLDKYGPLYEIGYNEFDDSVILSKEDVLVAITAPWCQHCQKLKKVLNATAEIFKGTNKRLYYFDADGNDIPNSIPRVEGYPTIFLWSQNNKKSPKEYTGDRSIESFVEFLQLGSEIELPEYNEAELKKKYDIC